MSLKKLIKENLVLTVGLALPILLIVVFMISVAVPKMFATPPQYQMLFSTHEYSGGQRQNYNTIFVVRKGKLRASLTKRDKDSYHTYQPRLYIYDGKKNTVREIHVDAPEDFNNKIEVDVAELKNHHVDTSSLSPDGYTFSTSYGGSRGLFGEVFGGGYRSRGAHVTNGTAAFRIPRTGSRHYYNHDANFIGWIVDKK